MTGQVRSLDLTWPHLTSPGAGVAEYHLTPGGAHQLHLGLDQLLEDLTVEVNSGLKSRLKSSSKLSVAPRDTFGPRPASPPGHRGPRGAGCPGGEGNYGFNSFNFMTFTLLVFNLVANVNNNLNNNNNNANKNNINAINQDSNNVASNTNAVNQIGVTVLPIPGKRSAFQVCSC